MGDAGSIPPTDHELLWRACSLDLSLGKVISGGSLDPGSVVSKISIAHVVPLPMRQMAPMWVNKYFLLTSFPHSPLGETNYNLSGREIRNNYVT